MFTVKLIKGNLNQTYGTYSTQEQADDVAAIHRATGYWAAVTVERT